MQNKLTIKRGHQEILTADRDLLIDVNHSGDGIVFNFKDGVFITFTMPYMKPITKTIISDNVIKYPKGDVTIDLINELRPVSISFS